MTLLLPCAVVYNDNYLEGNFTHTVQVNAQAIDAKGHYFPSSYKYKQKNKEDNNDVCSVALIFMDYISQHQP